MKKIIKLKTVILGAICGIINGFFGSGGGIIAVQSLEKIGVQEKNSHATSLFVIFPLSFISAIVYFFTGNISLNKDLFMLLIGAAIGGTVGAFFLNKIKTKWLDLLFTILIFASGIRMMF